MLFAGTIVDLGNLGAIKMRACGLTGVWLALAGHVPQAVSTPLQLCV
jgi:hypothetical protein